MSNLRSSLGKAGRVVVIGAGGAGIAAVETLRKAASSVEIVVVSHEDEIPYYRLNLTRYLAGEVNRADLFIHPAGWYQQQQIELIRGTEISAIHPAEHAVELSDGRRLAFDKLLLAAGARRACPWSGGELGRGCAIPQLHARIVAMLRHD